MEFLIVVIAVFVAGLALNHDAAWYEKVNGADDEKRMRLHVLAQYRIGLIQSGVLLAILWRVW